jgi:putative PIN family toxin of toxin-antitoxin system
MRSKPSGTVTNNMRVILDANVVVSGLISQRGAPRQLLDLWREEAFELVVSEAILDELGRVLRYPKIVTLHRQSDSELNEFLSLLREDSHLVVPTESVGASPDESDNRYLEAALAGEAEYLVTGDAHHLLPLGEYRGVRILPPVAFLAIVQLLE